MAGQLSLKNTQPVKDRQLNTKSFLQGLFEKRYLLGVSILIVIAVFIMANGIDRSFYGRDHTAVNGSFFSIIARNYLRYGLLKTHFAQVTNGALTTPEAFGHYTHHPPILPMLIALMFKIFGEHEWAARLVPITFSVASILMIYMLARELWGSRAGLISSIAFVISPMFRIYGNMVNFEPVVTFFLLLSSFAYVKWLRTGSQYYLGLLCISIFFGVLTDWPMNFLIGILFLHYLIFVKEKRPIAIMPAATALISLGLFYLQLRSLGPSAINDLISSFFYRTNLGTESTAKVGLSAWIISQVDNVYYLFTAPLIILGILGLIVPANPRQEKEKEHDIAVFLLAGFLAVAIFNIFIFRQAAYIHIYWAYYFIIPLALGTGVALEYLSSYVPKNLTLVPAIIIFSLIFYMSASFVSTGLNMHHSDPGAEFERAFLPITRPGDVVLTPSIKYFSETSLRYYGQITLIDEIRNLQDFKDALKKYHPAFILPVGGEISPDLLDYLVKGYQEIYVGNYLVFDLRKAK